MFNKLWGKERMWKLKVRFKFVKYKMQVKQMNNTAEQNMR